MNRQELVATATKAGIKKASTIKSTVLEQMIAEFNNNNNLKIKVMNPETTTKQKGRPVVEGSARQARLAARAARAEANGGIVKRGRPAKVKETEAAA
jgi:ribosome recycling factor